MRRKWYHCTTEYRGPLWRADLRVPVYVKEPTVPRLCVAPTVAECFAARLFPARDVHVYSVECSAVKPRGLWDQVITRERWIVHKAVLQHERTVPKATVDEITCAVHLYFRAGAKATGLRVRLCQLAIAARVLGPKYVFSWADEFLRSRGIHDPEDYILDRAVELMRKSNESD